MCISIEKVHIEMGVQNLLPLLVPISKRVPLSAFSGQRIGIDGFVWLHKASFRCAKDLVNDPGSEKILPYLMNMLEKVISCGITPVIIFDGQQLPQKANTNKKRHIDRMEARVKAIELEALGDTDQAYTYYQKAVEITSATVFTWVQKLREYNIEYYVAPYEADAQLAYLCRTSFVDCVLTEDSDLLPYQTPVVLFKFEPSTLSAIVIRFEDVLSHLQLTVDQFIGICCYSGCDYLEHINKLGISTAIKLMKAYGDPFEMLRCLKEGGKYDIPCNYEEQLRNSMLTYQAQRVFNPRTKELETLIPITDDQEGEFLGPLIAPDLIPKIVSCEIDTRTYAKLRVETQTGPVSPYFKKSSINKKKFEFEQQSMIPVKSCSKYFQVYKNDDSDSKIHTRSAKSYLQLGKYS